MSNSGGNGGSDESGVERERERERDGGGDTQRDTHRDTYRDTHTGIHTQRYVTSTRGCRRPRTAYAWHTAIAAITVLCGTTAAPPAAPPPAAPVEPQPSSPTPENTARSDGNTTASMLDKSLVLLLSLPPSACTAPRPPPPLPAPAPASLAGANRLSTSPCLKVQYTAIMRSVAVDCVGARHAPRSALPSRRDSSVRYTYVCWGA